MRIARVMGGLAVLGGCLVSYGADASAAQGEALLAAARAGVQAQEAKVPALEIESQTMTEEWDAGTRAWKFLGREHLHAVYDRAGEARCRIEMLDREWARAQGDPPRATGNGVTTFDGYVGLVYTHETAPSGHPDKPPVGQVMRSRPREVHIQAMYSGLGESIFGLVKYTGDPTTLSVLLMPGQKDVTVTAAMVMLDHVPCVKIERKIQHHTYQIYWLDPARQYAIVRAENYGPAKNRQGQPSWDSPVVTFSWTVEKFVEVSPGVYFPARVVIQGHPADAHISSMRSTVTILHATIPTQPLDPRMFWLEFAPGTLVTDAVTKQKVTIENAGAAQIRTLQSMLADEPPGAATQP